MSVRVLVVLVVPPRVLVVLVHLFTFFDLIVRLSTVSAFCSSSTCTTS